MTVWYPPELPVPMKQGYQSAFGDGRIGARRDAGPPSYRRRFSAVGDTVSLQTHLQRHELARFERFFLEETKRGSKTFFMPDPLTDGWPALTARGEPIALPDGSPMLLAKTWLCVFGEGLPSTVPLTNDESFYVSFDIVVLP